MALRSGPLNQEEMETIQQFAEKGGMDVIPLVAKTLNRSEKIVMEYASTLDLTPSPAPPVVTDKSQVSLANGIKSPATNSKQGVAIMTRSASEWSDERRQSRPKTHPSHIAPSRRTVSSVEAIEAQIADLTAQLEEAKNAADNSN